MRTFIALSLVVAIAFLAVPAVDAGDYSKKAKSATAKAEWFNLADCTICSQLGAHPDLMTKMTWEHHNVSNGIVSVTTVQEGYVDEYRKANKKMHTAGMKMQETGEGKLCGMCTSLSEVMMSGVKPEFVETAHGSVWVMTSDDEAQVKKLHKWAARTNAELKKMETGGHEGHGHEGHDHG